MSARWSDRNDFFRDIFGDPYMVWHDGPSFERLLSLQGDDLAEARGMLLQGIERGEYLAAEALAELGDAGAIAPLRMALPGGRGLFRVSVARALHRLTGDETFVTSILEVLRSRDHWSVRNIAAIELRHFTPTQAVVDGLARAVQDNEYVVRYHAVASLQHLAGKGAELDPSGEIFEAIAQPVTGLRMPWHRARWRWAADTLKGMVALHDERRR